MVAGACVVSGFCVVCGGCVGCWVVGGLEAFKVLWHVTSGIWLPATVAWKKYTSVEQSSK